VRKLRTGRVKSLHTVSKLKSIFSGVGEAWHEQRLWKLKREVQRAFDSECGHMTQCVTACCCLLTSAVVDE
jgi:protein-arginine kinase